MTRQDVLATYDDLGDVSRRFLDYLQEDPEASRAFDYHAAAEKLDAPEWGVRYNEFPLHSWPVLVGERKRREIERATVGVTDLVRSIPERLLDNDPKRVSEALGIDNELMAMLLLEPPTGLEHSVARCDFMDSEAGFKCVEVNMGTNIGGWDLRFWKEICLRHSANTRFFEAEGITPYFRDPVQVLFAHVVDVTRHLATEGELNIAIVVDDFELERFAASRDHVDRFYSEVLSTNEPSLSGTIVLDCYPGRFETRQGYFLHHGDTRIHAVLECGTKTTPEQTFRCFKAETLNLFDGPLAQMLGNRRLLGLLSEHVDSGLFDREEQTVIRDNIPWSREVTGREADFRGEKAPIPELLRAHKDELVIKKGFGAHGVDVHLGRFTDPSEWERLVDRATREEDWMAQEFIHSRPYLFQHGENGSCPHHLVWGTFVFGDRYGGAFLRTIPEGQQAGPINSQQGAIEGFAFEV